MPDGQGSTPAELVRCANCGRMNRVPAAARGTPRCGNCHQRSVNAPAAAPIVNPARTSDG